MVGPRNMEIPKCILHPSLILASGGLILALVWQDWEIPKATMLPDKSSLILVEGIADNGTLKLAGLTNSVVLDDSRFTNPDSNKKVIMQEFFLGKLIDRVQAKTGKLTLPLAVYDQACFDTQKISRQTLNCPVWLQP